MSKGALALLVSFFLGALLPGQAQEAGVKDRRLEALASTNGISYAMTLVAAKNGKNLSMTKVQFEVRVKTDGNLKNMELIPSE